MAKKFRYLLTVDAESGQIDKIELLGESGDLTEISAAEFPMVPAGTPARSPIATPGAGSVVINVFAGGGTPVLTSSGPASVSAPGGPMAWPGAQTVAAQGSPMAWPGAQTQAAATPMEWPGAQTVRTASAEPSTWPGPVTAPSSAEAASVDADDDAKSDDGDPDVDEV